MCGSQTPTPVIVFGNGGDRSGVYGTIAMIFFLQVLPCRILHSLVDSLLNRGGIIPDSSCRYLAFPNADQWIRVRVLSFYPFFPSDFYMLPAKICIA